MDAAPDPHTGGARLTVKTNAGLTEVFVGPRANGPSLARSRSWEISIAGVDAQPRDVDLFEAILRRNDDVDLDATPEGDRVEEFAPRLAPAPADTTRFLEVYRAPRAIAALMAAARTAISTNDAIARPVACLRERYPEGARRSLRVCDAGAGLGVLVHALGRAGFESVFGIERMPPYVIAAHAAGIPVRYGDATQLHRIAGPLDVVTCVRVFDAPELASKSSRGAFLDAISRALVRGGELVISGAGDLRVRDLQARGLERCRWPNPPLPGRPVHLFVKR